jgi:hypothetical protein
MENMEQTITVKDVKILETVEDIQERRDQVKNSLDMTMIP